ncbi:phage antirepressor, partial [bacterium]|nr:phage antirepressor [bacterium]
VLALLGQTHMEAEKQEVHFNVSDLVDGISGQRMNKMLAAAGLQTREGEQWVPTTDGKDFCRIFDTGKRHGSGAPITAIKWSKEVLDLLTLGEAS